MLERWIETKYIFLYLTTVYIHINCRINLSWNTYEKRPAQFGLDTVQAEIFEMLSPRAEKSIFASVIITNNNKEATSALRFLKANRCEFAEIHSKGYGMEITRIFLQKNKYQRLLTLKKTILRLLDRMCNFKEPIIAHRPISAGLSKVKSLSEAVNVIEKRHPAKMVVDNNNFLNSPAEWFPGYRYFESFINLTDSLNTLKPAQNTIKFTKFGYTTEFKIFAAHRLRLFELNLKPRISLQIKGENITNDDFSALLALAWEYIEKSEEKLRKTSLIRLESVFSYLKTKYTSKEHAYFLINHISKAFQYLTHIEIEFALSFIEPKHVLAYLIDCKNLAKQKDLISLTYRLFDDLYTTPNLYESLDWAEAAYNLTIAFNGQSRLYYFAINSALQIDHFCEELGVLARYDDTTGELINNMKVFRVQEEKSHDVLQRRLIFFDTNYQPPSHLCNLRLIIKVNETQSNEYSIMSWESVKTNISHSRFPIKFDTDFDIQLKMLKDMILTFYSVIIDENKLFVYYGSILIFTIKIAYEKKRFVINCDAHVFVPQSHEPIIFDSTGFSAEFGNDHAILLSKIKNLLRENIPRIVLRP